VKPYSPACHLEPFLLPTSLIWVTHALPCSEVAACQARITALEAELAAAAAEHSSRLAQQQKAFLCKLEQLRQVHNQQVAAAIREAQVRGNKALCYDCTRSRVGWPAREQRTQAGLSTWFAGQGNPSTYSSCPRMLRPAEAAGAAQCTQQAPGRAAHTQQAAGGTAAGRLLGAAPWLSMQCDRAEALLVMQLYCLPITDGNTHLCHTAWA
jgi:hypothetical protein